MTINYGVIAYDVESGEILKFIPSDVPITPEISASIQEQLKHEITGSFSLSPASAIMCKYFSMKKP